MKKKVQVIVTTKNKQVLLLQTNKRRGQFWQNVTGGVENSENFFEAALRESQEETGISEKIILEMASLKMQFRFKDQYGDEVDEHCFHLKLKEQFEPTLDQNEHQAYQWLHFNQVSKENYRFLSNYQVFLKVSQ